MRFRKKPVVIEAEQLRWDNWSAVAKLCGLKTKPEPVFGPGEPRLPNVQGCYVDAEGKVTTDTNGRIGLLIPTWHEGVVLAVDGDWIIRDAEGAISFCKPDIFKVTYEPIVGRCFEKFYCSGKLHLHVCELKKEHEGEHKAPYSYKRTGCTRRAKEKKR